MTFNANSTPYPEDDELSVEDAEVLNPETYQMQYALLASSINDEDEYDSSQMTKMFLDLTQVYCSLLEAYPQLRLQIEELIQLSASKERNL